MPKLTLEEVMARAIREPLLEEVTDIVNDLLSKQAAARIQVNLYSQDDQKDVKELGVQHALFPKLLDLVSLGHHVWMVGPAGSGKSSAASAVGKAMQRDFYSMQVGPDTRPHNIVGYLNAMGELVKTPMYEAAQKGALVCFDEVDSANAASNTTINRFMDSSEFIEFVGEFVQRHPKLTIIGTANTYGMGANRVYVGRNQQDGATLDRFTYLDWPYDENMEMQISPSREWTLRVQQYRKIADTKGIRLVISPRASIKGGLLFIAMKQKKTNHPWSLEEIENACIFKQASDDEKRLLRAEYAKAVPA